MNRPMMFFAADGCGCSQTGNSPAVFPVTGALVCDDRYLSLASSPRVQLLGVPRGSNCQGFLRGPNNIRGFVFDDGSESYVEPEPKLTLPVLNTLSGSSYNVPPGFQFLIVGTGANPHPWKFVAAPSAGQHILRCTNGQWQVVDAGIIPGLNEIGAGTEVNQGMLIALNETETPGVYEAKKLHAIDGRVLVGFEDEDGNETYGPLPADQFLTHPKARFADGRVDVLHVEQLKFVEDLDADPLVEFPWGPSAALFSEVPGTDIPQSELVSGSEVHPNLGKDEGEPLVIGNALSNRDNICAVATSTSIRIERAGLYQIGWRAAFDTEGGGSPTINIMKNGAMWTEGVGVKRNAAEGHTIGGDGGRVMLTDFGVGVLAQNDTISFELAEGSGTTSVEGLRAMFTWMR